MYSLYLDFQTVPACPARPIYRPRRATHGSRTGMNVRRRRSTLGYLVGDPMYYRMCCQIFIFSTFLASFSVTPQRQVEVRSSSPPSASEILKRFGLRNRTPRPYSGPSSSLPSPSSSAMEDCITGPSDVPGSSQDDPIIIDGDDEILKLCYRCGKACPLRGFSKHACLPPSPSPEL